MGEIADPGKVDKNLVKELCKGLQFFSQVIALHPSCPTNRQSILAKADRLCTSILSGIFSGILVHEVYSCTSIPDSVEVTSPFACGASKTITCSSADLATSSDSLRAAGAAL